ncbi:DUF192 domain-containing protein [Stieleria mannarensis]|uniref:DUF192 domain-containing protein n=1 Tax=Stieleria mannarensis TaxID=2755585 RepID=UPI0016015026|nr:DUF192 domain-containing protein [Rhodopirellula sp. JC639]
MQKPQLPPRHRLIDAESGRVLIEHLEIADSVWSRFRGWMFKGKTRPSSAILIRPCGSIHTMWMRMAIDVVFLSNDDTVIGARRGLRPWRIAIAPRGTTSVLETPAGQSDLAIGVKLRIEEVKR